MRTALVGFGAVVARDDDQGVLGQPMLLQVGEQQADMRIELRDEVTVRPGRALAAVMLARERRQVHRLGGVVEEERPPRFRPGLSGEEIAATPKELLVDFRQVEVGRDYPGPAIVGVRVTRELRAIQRPRGRSRDAVTVDVSIEPVGARTAGRAEEAFESVIERATFDPARVVDAPGVFGSARLERCAVGVAEGQAEVPFAHGGRGVTLGLEHRGQSQTACCDQRRSDPCR